MLKIRLQRIGRSNKSVYRIVVTEHTASPTASYVELVGHYDPLKKPKVFQADESKIMEWIKKGAKPSNTVARLLKGKGVKGMEPYIVAMTDRKKKSEMAEAAAAPAAVPAKAENPAPDKK